MRHPQSPETRAKIGASRRLATARHAGGDKSPELQSPSPFLEDFATLKRRVGHYPRLWEEQFEPEA